MNLCWYNKLVDVLRIQTNSENEKLMVLYLDKELKRLKLPYTIDAAGNVLVIKGKSDLYPCVVSHMDTVHNFVPNFKIYHDINDNDILFALNGVDSEQKVGIGGDDKCGIFACLYLLATLPIIKVVFFSREESGCKGSGSIDKGFFTDCQYIIQLDRRNSRDFIQTSWIKKTVSHGFSSEIGVVKKKYKYKNATGTVTDVMKLWNRGVGVSCINLSCGYHKPHTDNEYVSISELWHSVKFTEEIINTLQSKKYPSLPPPPTVISTSAVTGLYNSVYKQCCDCKQWKKEVLLYKVKNSPGDLICWSCKKEQYNKVGGKKKSKKLPGKEKPKDNSNDKKQQDNPTPNITPFACHECGLTAGELRVGDSLSPINGELYCNGCTLLFSIPNKENSPTICEICEEEIPNDHYRTTIQGMLVCGVCAYDLDEYSEEGNTKRCWVCNAAIPKDCRIIKRFGKRICEYCSHPSDIIISEN